ncbi:EAL domain-containing protein [Metabacillus bambusae]|uniref:EAL domain-containing protein n=1 Tax=Metabacillus bambusae TaxID=2795218 RepID=A0ABS3NAD4_9BACI|nr:EAL domain-containing protein [Metabacillus bambusae]MBO1514883.1 EAL domain-containing protein [Metabacillus bambusae]
MKNISTNKTIISGMMIMMVFIMIIGSIAIYTTTSINSASTDIMKKYTQSIELIYHMKSLTGEVLTVDLMINEETDLDKKVNHEEELEKLKQDVQNNFAEIELIHGENLHPLYSDFYDSWEKYVELQESSATKPDEQLIQNKKDQFDKVMTSLNELLDYEKNMIDTMKKEQKKEYTVATKTIWCSLFIFLFLSCIATFYLGKVLLINKKNKEKINYLAYHDSLTGLSNRSLFNEKLNNRISLAKKEDKKLAVMFLDLDRFKNINDTLGHEKGDLLIKLVAERLVKCIGENGIVSRRGGDEFTILILNVETEIEVKRIASDIINVFNDPFQLEASKINVTASIGISTYPKDGEDSDTLLRIADMAMYQVKGNGKNSFNFITEEDQEKMEKAIRLETDLFRAVELDCEQFRVCYQPKVNLSTEKITGAEALIRWKHPEFGFISPVNFLSIAEETGLILPIGEWVIRQACNQNRLIQQLGYEPIKIAINLSVVQFFQPDIVQTIKRIITETKANPLYLEFEITESVAMSDFNLIEKRLKELKSLGVTIAMDDFGTGYSSLNYLKKLPIDTLKIDQSFIKDIHDDQHDQTLIKTIISMAKGLNLHVVAEGVEMASHADLLKKENCQEAQGYFYSRPLKSKNFLKILEDSQAFNSISEAN